MREMKFRAWDKIDKVMIPNLQNRAGFSGDMQCINHEVMEYTGLKDKKGVEIYEGDILAFDYKEYGSKKDYNFSVERSKNGEWVGAGLCTEWERYCKIIGNTYENKELLK